MTVFVALLRAINVGGTGKLAMTDLKALAEKSGFGHVRTYIASGNVLFTSEMPEAAVKLTLESALKTNTGKPVWVLIRSAAEIAAVLLENPFEDVAPNRVAAIFLDEPPENLDGMTGHRDEEIRLGRREIYVHYPSGMGNSKLKMPTAKTGTARNMNTVAKLAAMATAL